MATLLGRSHGQRHLADYSLQGHKELDTTEATEHSGMHWFIIKDATQEHAKAEIHLAMYGWQGAGGGDCLCGAFTASADAPCSHHSDVFTSPEALQILLFRSFHGAFIMQA